MFDWIKNNIIGQSRGEALSPYADALNSASSNYNTAVQWNQNAKNYLSEHSDIDQNSNLYKTLSQIASDDFTNSYKNELDTYQNYWNQAKKQNQYNIFGTGIGSALNDLFQAESALWDLGESGTDKWKRGERDLVSDIGAGINTGINAAAIATGAAGLTGGLATKAAPTLGKAILSGTGRGALYGGVGNLGNYLKTAGNESKFGDAALQTALGAGIGGVFGGTLSGLNYGLGNLRSKAISGNQKVAEAAAAAQKAKGDVTAYQDAMKAAQDLGLDTSSDAALRRSYATMSTQTAPDTTGRAIALLPATTSTTAAPAETVYLTSGAKVPETVATTGIYGKANAFTPTAADYMKSINENAVKYATEAQKALNETYGTLTGRISNNTLSDLLSTSKSAQSALKKASNQALLDYLKNTKLGRLGSTKLGKAAAVGGTAYGISRLLGNRNGGNNE